jgi:hypothetical protein
MKTRSYPEVPFGDAVVEVADEDAARQVAHGWTTVCTSHGPEQNNQAIRLVTNHG